MNRHPFHKRLLKEQKSLSQNNLAGITLLSNSDDITKYIFKMDIKNHSLYKDLYCLSVEITKEYPVDSPRVQFIICEIENTGKKSVIPIHPHIYSNGHICLNILGEDWTPACSIESILVSIQSMLDTNTVLERPEDDQLYVRTAPWNPKVTKFVYHDDDV